MLLPNTAGWGKEGNLVTYQSCGSVGTIIYDLVVIDFNVIILLFLL